MHPISIVSRRDWKSHKVALKSTTPPSSPPQTPERMNPMSVPRSPTKTAALIVNFAGVDVETFVGQGGRVGGRWLPFAYKFWSHCFVWSRQACGARNLLWAQSQKKEKKVYQIFKHVTLENGWDFKAAAFGETFPRQLTLQNFCGGKKEMCALILPSSNPKSLQPFVVFSHRDWSRKGLLQRWSRKRKPLLARLAWILVLLQHIYQLWISYWKRNKERRWRLFSLLLLTEEY